MPHTPRLRRAALTVLLALSAGLLTAVLGAAPASAAPPTYVVSGDPAGSGGEQWQFGDSSATGYFTELRALLTDGANFGPGGTVRANYTLAPAPTLPLTAQKLANIDVYVLSGRELVGSELTVLNNYVRSGGTVVASSNGPNFFDVTGWAGFTLTDRNVYGDDPGDTTHRAPAPFATVVPEQANHPIMNGPFGTVTTFDGWHSVAGFRQIPPQAVALARTPLTFPGGYTNTVALAVVPFGALGNGAGGIVATSDIDTFSNAYKTKADGHADDLNNTLTGTGNGVLARNVFAWIAAQKMQHDGVTSGYVSLTSPVRALDTRATSAFGGNEARDLSLLGAGVPADATMVAVNVTAVDPTAGGFLTVWPADSPLPVVSSVNFTAGTTVANAAFVKLGPNARIAIYNSSGRTHVLVDVVGYVASSGSRLVNVGPTRIKDTRSGLGGTGQAHTDTTQTLQVSGNGGVPNGATGVILNVTAVDATATSFVTAWPADQSRPTVSNINTVAGTTVPNLVVVRLPTSGGAAGKINLYNAAGDTHLLVDVLGYYTNAAPAGSITPETPHRQLDTRSTNTPLGAGQTRTIATGLPGATAVIINVTAVDPSATGYLTVYPADRSQPDASNVNFYAGRNTPNLVVVHPASDGTIKVFNSAGTTQLLVDVIGRFDG